MENFTAFRVGSATFTKGCNGCVHHHFRFIECGSGLSHKLTNPSYGNDPIYVDLLTVGSLTNPMGSGGGTMIHSAAFEGWYIDGATFVNHGSNYLIASCFACLKPGFRQPITVRTRRFSFISSTHTFRRSKHSHETIYWDLDGSITGLGPDSWVAGSEGSNFIILLTDYELTHFRFP